MTCRPSYARFELNAVSPLAAVFPASFQAAAVGSILTLVGFVATGVMDESFSVDRLSFWAIPGLAFFALTTTAIGTVLCAFYIAIVGVPVAWLLGRKLASPLGLLAAVGAALLAGAGAGGVMGVRSLSGELEWLVTLLVFTYALPAGLLYRRAVLDARRLSPFAELNLAA